MQPGISVLCGTPGRHFGQPALCQEAAHAQGGATAVHANDDVAGAAGVRELDKRVRDLGRMLGRKPWRSRSSWRRSISPPPKSQRCGSPRSTRAVRCEDRRGHNRRLPLQLCRADEELAGVFGTRHTEAQGFRGRGGKTHGLPLFPATCSAARLLHRQGEQSVVTYRSHSLPPRRST